MFSWHETTLRGLCRLAFGLLVAAPDVRGALGGRLVPLPLSVEYHRRALSEQLALDVQLDRVSFPRPDVTVLRGLSLADPETAAPAGPIRSAGVANERPKHLRSLARRAELFDSSRLDLREPSRSPRRLRSLAGAKTVVEIQAQELIVSLADGTEPQALTKVRGQWQSEPSRPQTPGTPSEPQATVEFHLKAAGNVGPGTDLVLSRGLRRRER